MLHDSRIIVIDVKDTIEKLKIIFTLLFELKKNVKGAWKGRDKDLPIVEFSEGKFDIPYRILKWQ